MGANFTRPVGGSGATFDIPVAQAAHPFSAPDLYKPVQLVGDNTYDLATADTVENAEVVGVLTKIVDANNIVITWAGVIDVPIAGPAGTTVFLAQAGGFTTTEPGSADISKALGNIKESGVSIFFENYRGLQSTAGSGTSGGGGGAITDTNTQFITYDDEKLMDGQNQWTAQSGETYTILKSGYLIGFEVEMNTPRTAGSILFKPTKNGTPITSTNLDLNINGSNQKTNSKFSDIDDASYFFNVGDVLSYEATSTGFAPLSNRADINLTFKTNN